MKTPVDSLVRVHRWKVDEARQKVADLETLAQKLAGDLANLEEELIREQKLAEEKPELAPTFPAYLKAFKQRRTHIENSITEVERSLSEARAELHIVFQELKKYEEAQANDLERQRAKLRKKELENLDEIGIQLYRRRRNAEG